MKQHWNNYTNDDHEVWKILFERQVKNLANKSWSRYLQCIPQAGIHAGAVPDFSNVETTLKKTTSWKIEVVKGIIPVKEFMELLSQKRFCSSTWLRKRHQLDYLEEPDMFHDTFGHIPLLADEKYSTFVKQFAETGLKFVHDERAVMLLERLYWFTIEFGLMRENGDLKIYGAGLLSSFGETNHVYSDKVGLKNFTVRDVLFTPFRNNEVQQLYFVVNDMNDLWNCLRETENILRDVVAGKIPEETLRLREQVGAGAMG